MMGGKKTREGMRDTEQTLLASKQHYTCIKVMCAEIMISRDMFRIMLHLIRRTGFGKPILLKNKQTKTLKSDV